MSTTAAPTQAMTDDLVARLVTARNAYYNQNPVMSDAAYDLLEDELRALDPNHPFLAKVGAVAPTNGWPKTKHTMPMGSLNKAQDDSEMRAWFQACLAAAIDKMFLIIEKMDGISISLRYETGRLVRAVTRGDGEEGEDILRNVLLMKGVPHFIPGFTGHVRGEIVCLRSDFEAHFKTAGYSNPRNTASGTAKRESDPEPCKHLTVIAYEWLPDVGTLASKKAELEAIKAAGFTTPHYTVTDKGADAIAYLYQKYIDGIRDALDYDIDGLVIYVNDNPSRESLGDLNKRPKGAVAYKFPHDQKRTILRNIRWQVGNSGRITPVAEFDVVNLAGANVKQASLHNVAMIRTLADRGTLGTRKVFAAGDEILVARRNDVIPYVEELLVPAMPPAPPIADVSDADVAAMLDDDVPVTTAAAPANVGVTLLPIPTTCPDCGATLVMQGEYLVCPNTSGCGAQTVGAIKRWLDKLNVLEWGDAAIQALCSKGLIKEPADLYALDVQTIAAVDLGGRVIGGSAQVMYDNLHAKMDLPLDLIVGSLGIPLWGRSMCQILVQQGLDSVAKLTAATVADIAKLPGVGQTKAEAFVDGFQTVYPVLFNLFQAGVTVAVAAVGAMTGKTVCYTEIRSPEQESAFAAQGGVVKGSVSKTLTYLVAKDVNGTTGKAAKAREYQGQGFPVQIITLDDMWALLGGKPAAV